MRVRNRGGQMLVTTAGAFVAFSLMTIAVGTDYWLYSPGVCRTSAGDNETSPKNEEMLTHSGLWRQCCMEGMFTGVCKNFDHFPDDAEYEQDAAEYLLRAVRASSLFPIMSAGLLFVGGGCVVCVGCVAANEFYKRCHIIILSAGVFFVSSGLSNIIGIIVYISANASDPNQSESKRSHWYGWSFYCAALSFIIAETVGGLAVHLFIETHRARRTHAQLSLQPYKLTRLQRRHSFGYCSRRAQSCPFHPPTRDRAPSLHGNDLALYPLGQGFMPPTLPRDFHNMIIANNLSSTHMQRLQNFVKSDNSFPPNLMLKPEEKGVDVFDAHVNSSVKVDSGPVVNQHMFKSVIDGELVTNLAKEHSFLPLSGSTIRRTTPV